MTLSAPEIKPGTKVRSRYRAAWTGIVLEEIDCHKSKDYKQNHNHIVVCLVTHDRHGKPMRKPFRSQALSTFWLEVIG